MQHVRRARQSDSGCGLELGPAGVEKKFIAALEDFLKNPENVQVAGDYRGTPARHYVNLRTGQHVSMDLAEMLASFKSDPIKDRDQLWYLAMHGKL
ncbi:hypothetical protein OG522_06860 [Streptomyces sp. NBC_01431]|nr:hypothetical protein [Streptomyces sp. NBC_01431]